MSVIVKDTVDYEFKNCRSIYDINEYIYKLICKNKHLKFVESLEPDITSFSKFRDNVYLIPNSYIQFSYQDIVKGYSVAFDATPDLDILINPKIDFTLDDELTPINIHTEVNPIGELKELNEKAYKEINRFRSDFLMAMDNIDINFREFVNIKYMFTFDFNNDIIDSSISFYFNFRDIEFTELLYNFKITTDGITCCLSHKNHYEHFLVGDTSNHMMLKFFFADMGIDVDLEMRNNTKEEISNLMLLIDMKRI